MSGINPNSKRLSELHQVKTLLDDDILIIERKQDDYSYIAVGYENDSEYIKREIDNDYIGIENAEVRSAAHTQSYKLTYGMLKTYIASLLSSDFGTMAHCDKEDFAKAAHGHDSQYNDFWIFPSYGPDSGNSEYASETSCIQVGQFDIRKYLPGEDQYEDNRIGLYVPITPSELIDSVSNFGANKVGDIQMLAVPNFESYLTGYRGYSMTTYGGIRNIDYTSPSFDGFMIPNGATVQCGASQFKQACKMYSESKSETATSFTLPNFVDFIKANCDHGNTDNGISAIPYKNAVPYHTHGGSSAIQAQSQITMDFDPLAISADASGQHKFEYETVCRGSNSTAAKQCTGKSGSVICRSPEIKVTGFKFTDCRITSELTCHEQTGYDYEAYPSHYLMPALIYVGR